MSNLSSEQFAGPTGDATKAYHRGWNASKRPADKDGTRSKRLEAAPAKEGLHYHRWQDGWDDYAEDRDKGHSLTCPGNQNGYHIGCS
jgi:hypothetical protein